MENQNNLKNFKEEIIGLIDNHNFEDTLETMGVLHTVYTSTLNYLSTKQESQEPVTEGPTVDPTAELVIPDEMILSNMITNHSEPLEEVKTKRKFEDNVPIKYGKDFYVIYGKLDEEVLFADHDLAEQINWMEEFRELEERPELDTDDILEILGTVIDIKSVDKVSLFKKLETGLTTPKFKIFLQDAFLSWKKSKSLVPVNELILTDHQQEVFDGVISKVNEIIVYSNPTAVRQSNDAPAKYMATFEGAAGTGKTTVMGKILQTLVNEGHTLCFCSPTHQALNVIRETLIEQEIDFTESPEEFTSGYNNIIIKTLASFLGIKMKRDLETGTEVFTTDKRANLFKVDILCVDESSMISRDQLTIILKRLRVDYKMILFIGDEPQLPSPSDKNQSNGIFNIPYKYSLLKVVRQAEGSELLKLAHEIRNDILSFNTYRKPSEIITQARSNNHDIFIYNDQAQYMDQYFNDPEESKIITTYTNKITNEYNNYIRSLAVTNQIPGTKPEIVCNGKSLDDLGKEGMLNYISDWVDYKEYYPGEKVIIGEAHQRGGNVVHQNGEIIRIHEAKLKTYKLHIDTPSDNMMEGSNVIEYSIDYWEIIDTDYRKVRTIASNQDVIYTNIINLLRAEADKSSGKHKWKKFYAFKEQFIKINYLFAGTLYKMQGSTYQNLYADLRDLDKFHSWDPVIVYKLLYVALTRPKQKVIILI